MSSKKEEKDGCCFLWQGFYGSVDVVNFPIFKEKEVKQVALGGDHCLFLTKDGGVYACGQNNYGQLGIGNLETKETHDPVLVESLTDKEIDYIACGSNHSAAVTKYGDVFCWGVSSEGQCGVPEGSEKLHEGTVPLPQLIEIVKTCNEVCEHGNAGPHEKIAIQKIACGKNHTVALSVDNELWVWGSGIALGVNTVTKSVTPIQIEAFNGRNVLDIVCGEMYTMALVERSLLDIAPRKRPSNIEKTTHKLFPSTCSKCNEEIYSYMETSDTCIITEDHVCKDTVKTSVSDQSQAIINLEELVDTSQSQQSLQTVISKENKITTEEGSTVTSGTSIENVTGDDKLLKGDNPGSESESMADNPATQPNIQRSISDENVWQRQKPEIERSLSSKSDHRVSRSKSFLDGKNVRQFLAKQLDDDDLALKFDSNGAVSDGSAAKGAVTDIWSTVQTGMQSAYAIPQQMTGMLSGFKTSLMDRMSASAPEEKEKEDTNSSVDSNIHLVGFDTSDEDVFHATQIVESQLGKDFRKSSTSKSPDPKTPKKSDCSFGETTFIEGIKTEMLFLDDSKTDELDQSKTVDPGEVTPKRRSQSAETTTKRSSMRTILAKQEELERKVSTRSSTAEDEMKRPSIIIDTEVWSWGKNSKGQLGVGDMGDRPNPTIVKALSNKRITKICCGTTHGMALTANSQVYSWGSNASGQLGRKEEAALPGLIKMVPGCFIWDIAAGSCFSIFLIDRAGFQPEVFFVGKHPTKDLYVPNHETNRLTSLNFLKQAGWIRSIVAGGDNSCCTSCYSFSGYFMTLFEVAATERKFYFYLHKVMKLLLDPLQKSAFYTSLDVYPYKSTLQNLMTAFQRIFTKICESMIEMTGMISKGEDLLQTSFFTNYSRYTVEYKRYYVALSDMLAVAGFEYICKTGRFPVNRRHKSIWQCRVSRKQWKPTSCSRLCSEHFITKRGPTKDHPLPSIFDHKIFKTTNFDSSFKEFDENNDCTSTEDETDRDIICDGNEEANNGIADDPSKHFFTVDSPSTINTSVRLNDYCGYIDPSHISSKFNQETQCGKTCTGTLNDFSSQTDTLTTEKENQPYTVYPITDAEVNATLPFLTIDDISSEEVTFYTGLPNKPTFYLLYEHIMSNIKIVEPETGGRPQKLRGVDELFMVLMRLRLGLLTQDLARRFNISVSTCSKIFNKWIDLMYEHLHFLVAWPDRETVKCNMPDSFKRRYPNCRVIIDCTEIFTETPQSLSNKGRMYSDYKSHMTWKVLIGISPNGVITHVSDLWSGSISDKQITKSSGLINKCDPGDAIMGDKGFLISDMCTPKGIYLIVPPTKKNGKLTKHEVEKTRRIANLRIHVERAMERIKNFRIIQGVMPISMSEKVSKIVFIVCALCNLLPPLIQQ